VWDLYPHTLVRAEMLRARGWPARLWTALNRRAFLAAELVITLGDRMQEIVREEIGAAANQAKVEIIPNWADTESIRPLIKATNPFAVTHHQQERVTVLYSGNLGAAHGVQDLVAASAHLAKDDRVAFMIIGDGLGRPEVEDAISADGAGSVTLLDYQPWEMLPYSLSTGDIAVVSQTPGTEDYSFPSKLYSSLAAGSAILAITDEDTDLGCLVSDMDVGVVAPAGDPEAIAGAIRALLDDPPRLQRMRENARRVAEDRFSTSVVRRRFEETLLPLIVASRAGAQ
jgi:glycosyltransferase involved in cell wall biosynthesis